MGGLLEELFDLVREQKAALIVARSTDAWYVSATWSDDLGLAEVAARRPDLDEALQIVLERARGRVPA